MLYTYIEAISNSTVMQPNNWFLNNNLFWGILHMHLSNDTD